MTLAISHRDKDGRAILDAVRERRPPFSPEGVTAKFVSCLSVIMSARFLAIDMLASGRESHLGLWVFRMSYLKSPRVTFIGILCHYSIAARLSCLIILGLSRRFAVLNIGRLEAGGIQYVVRLARVPMMTLPTAR